MKKQKVLYLCDRKKCKHCHTECKHTDDIKHAITFERIGNYYFEKINVQYAIAALSKAFEKIKHICSDVGMDWVKFIEFDGEHEFFISDEPIKQLIDDLKNE